MTAREGGITRRLRLRGAPRPPSRGSDCRLPRSLGAGFAAVLVVIYFFGSMGGNEPSFYLMVIGLVVGMWATLRLVILVHPPIRAPQRWRPRRRIAPLDTTGWKELAKSVGGRLVATPLPEISCTCNGVAVWLFFERDGGARTFAEAILTEHAGTPLIVRPRRARFRARHEIRTRDRAFDRRFRVECRSLGEASRRLGADARRWIDATEPEMVEVAGRRARTARKGFVKDADVLRGLCETVAAVA